MDYISRDFAKEFLYRSIDADAKGVCNRCVHDPYNCKYNREWTLMDFCERIESALDEIPAADVRPVKRGKWTDKRTIEHDGEWYCTACGKEITIYMGNDREDRYAYCPNCGADMREES